MGIDQVVCAALTTFKSETDFDKEISELPRKIEIKEIMEWGKRYEIDEWMKKIYYKKGGKSKGFFFNKVSLNKKDIKKLSNLLPKKKFYPDKKTFNTAMKYYYKYDMIFIKEAINLLDKGYVLWYYSF